MLKKNLALIIIIVAVLIGYVLLTQTNLFDSRYTLDGTIYQCTTKGAVVYQYSANVAGALPQHFSNNGSPIACDF